MLSLACTGSEQALRLDTVAAADTVGCGLVTATLHPDPDSLIAEFIRRNARGEFQRETTWFASAVDCPGHEPGPDVASEATVHGVRELSRDAGRVRKEVVWARLGYVSGDSLWEALGAEHDTLVAIRTPHGWRIQSPALRLRVPPMVPQEPSGTP
jgi:hypothetical protein